MQFIARACFRYALFEPASFDIAAEAAVTPNRTIA